MVVDLLNAKSSADYFKKEMISDKNKLLIAPFGRKKIKQISEEKFGEIKNVIFYPAYPVKIGQFREGVKLSKNLAMDDLYVLYAGFSSNAKILSHDIYRDVVMDPVFRLEGRSRFRKKIPKIYKRTESLLYLEKLNSEIIKEKEQEEFIGLQEDINIFSHLYQDSWDKITSFQRTPCSVEMLSKIQAQKDFQRTQAKESIEKQRQKRWEERAAGINVPKRLQDTYQHIYKIPPHDT